MTEFIEDEESEEIDVQVIYADADENGGELFKVSEAITSNDNDPFLDSAKNYYASMNRSMKRKITKAHKGVDGAGTKKWENEQLNGYGLYETVEPPYNMEALAQLYESSAPNKAAIDAKAANIVGLGYHFAESRATEEKVAGIDDVTSLERLRRKLSRVKHGLEDYVESWHQEDTFGETLMKVWKDVESTGNGYLEIGRSRNGRVGYVGHIPASTIRVRRNRDGFVQIVQNKVVFFHNFGHRESKNPLTNDNNSNEILHFKKYSPRNSYYGVPDILAALIAVAGNKFAAQYNLDYFENKAVPRYALIVKGGALTKKAEEHLKDYFRRGVKGKNHGTLYIPVPATQTGDKVDVQLVPIETGIQESSFGKYYMQNIKEIFMAHRVPPSKAGLTDGVNLAVAREADKTFKEQVCRPEQTRLEKHLNKIIAEVTDVYVLKLNEMTLTDEEMQSRILERYARINALNPNEIREKLGHKPYDGGDTFLDMFKKGQARAEERSQATRGRNRERASDDGPDNTETDRAPKGSRQDSGENRDS